MAKLNDLFLKVVREYIGDPRVLTDSGFVTGFVTGQAEKVHIGACRAAMFHPEVFNFELVHEIAANIAGIYGLQMHVFICGERREIWLVHPNAEAAYEAMVRTIEFGASLATANKLRGDLCGVEDIDPEYPWR